MHFDTIYDVIPGSTSETHGIHLGPPGQIMGLLYNLGSVNPYSLVLDQCT